jgi:hypothetical protein
MRKSKQPLFIEIFSALGNKQMQTAGVTVENPDRGKDPIAEYSVRLFSFHLGCMLLALSD